MLQKMKSFRAWLLMLVMAFCCVGNTWAIDEVTYTMDCPKGSNNAYATYNDVTVNGIGWKAPGNQNIDNGWRIGGKSISGVDRYIYSKTALTDNITKIEVAHGVSNITVNSFKLDVYSTAALAAAGAEGDISSMSGTFASATTATFTRPSDADWTGRFYRITWNVTNSTTNSKYVFLSSVTFYREKQVAAGQTLTTTTFPQAAYRAYFGESFTSPVATVSGGNNLQPTYSSSNTAVATVNATTGAITLVATGKTTITASFEGTTAYTSSSATYELTVGNAYANIQALQAGTTATEVPMKVTLNNVQVTGVNGKNAYINDGTYGCLIYTDGHGLSEGQIINGTLEASSQLYNGACEITNYSSTGLTITSGTLTPQVKAIADLSVVNEGMYITLKDVAYDGTNFSNGGNTIAYRDGLAKSVSLVSGKSYDVTGVYNYFKASQIYPVSATEVAVAVTAPTIALAGGSYKGAQNVTITQADGKSIYYTLDGTDPTTSTTAQLYSAAIAIAESATLKAAAKDGDTWSNVVTATYTIVPVYANIAAAKAAITATAKADAFDMYITLNDAVITYINGSNYFIQDATAGILIYNSSDGVKNALTAAGLKLNGDMKCAGYINNGLFQLFKNFDFTDVTKTTGAAVPCTELTIAELNANLAHYESMRIRIVDATVTSVLSSRYATIAQSTNKISVYERVSGNLESTLLATAQSGVTVVGYPYLYGTTNCLGVWEADDVIESTSGGSGKKTPTNTWSLTVATATMGQVGTYPTFTTNSDGAVTYSSSKTEVATINATTGVITLVAPGTTVITATTAATDDYEEASASYTLNVVKTSSATAATGDVLWSEDWTNGGTAKASDYKFSGTVVFDGQKVTYTQNYDATKLYNATLAGGTAPELLLAKKTSSVNGEWCIASIPTGYAKKMKLTFKSNKTSIALSSTTTGITFDEITFNDKDATCYITNAEGTAAYFDLLFSNTSTDNARIDNIVLTVYTAKDGMEVPLMTWSAEEAEVGVNVTCGENAIPTFTTNSTEKVTYTTSDASVATVDESGVITLKAAGTVTITASVPESASFAAAESSCTLHVYPYASYNVFTTNDWKTAGENWYSNGSGLMYTNKQGVQITSGNTAGATSPDVYGGIEKVVVTYCTNKDSGEATVTLSVGNEAVNNYNIVAPSENGTVLRTYEYVPAETRSGDLTITAVGSTNSAYIYSVAIFYDQKVVPTIGTITEIISRLTDADNPSTLRQVEIQANRVLEK